MAEGEESDMALAESRRELGEELVRVMVRGRAADAEAVPRVGVCCTKVWVALWLDADGVGVGRGRGTRASVGEEGERGVAEGLGERGVAEGFGERGEEEEPGVWPCATASTDLIRVTASVVLRGRRAARFAGVCVCCACASEDAGDDAMSSWRTSSMMVRRSFASCWHLSRRRKSAPALRMKKILRRVVFTVFAFFANENFVICM
jgi:hypothetical protein